MSQVTSGRGSRHGIWMLRRLRLAATARSRQKALDDEQPHLALKLKYDARQDAGRAVSLQASVQQLSGCTLGKQAAATATWQHLHHARLHARPSGNCLPSFWMHSVASPDWGRAAAPPPPSRHPRHARPSGSAPRWSCAAGTTPGRRASACTGRGGTGATCVGLERREGYAWKRGVHTAALHS